MNIKLVALLIQFLVSVAFNLMGSFLPLFINSDLNYTLIEATYWAGICQLVGSSFFAFTAPFWGSMCDRVGTKKIMMITLLGNTIVYAGMAVSTNVTQLIMFRALQGTLGGVSTAMFTLVASIEDAEELKTALSYQMAAMTMGSIFGPGLGSLLADLVGYRWTFAASALLFVSMVPGVLLFKTPPPAIENGSRFRVEDFRVILPDAVSLVLIYIGISFITPVIPWFLESLGTPYDQLLFYTAVVATLNGLAFAVATPILTRVVTDKTLPSLPALAAGAILMTTFARDPFQFTVLRIAIAAIQAGVPPYLLGGKSARVGTAIGFLNSARFMGMAIGPFIAAYILGDGTPPKPLYMFSTMAGLSLLASLVIYTTHTRKGSQAKMSDAQGASA